MVSHKLPDPDEHGLLPAGVHDSTLDEVGERYGSFQQTDRRCRLFDKLKDFFDEVSKTLPGATILVDGSYVMQCVDNPSDIDLVLGSVRKVQVSVR